MSEDRTRDSYSGKRLRILVVEDHSETLQALSRLLSHFGHEVSVADGAQNARNIFESREFDVVLCDIALPDGSGYDLIAEAKRKRPVKAVAISGLAPTEDRQLGREAGWNSHLARAVDFNSLRLLRG